jgi:hypothetical protein
MRRKNRGKWQVFLMFRFHLDHECVAIDHWDLARIGLQMRREKSSAMGQFDCGSDRLGPIRPIAGGSLAVAREA